MAMIPWWIHYPNVNNEIINQDWILQVSNENTDKIENFIGVNTIKYADPILWDITSQYEANTIVVDPQTGDAYISTKAVPYGVHLSNEDYWTKIYNYADAIKVFHEQIAAADEQLSTTATAPRAIGDLVWLNGLLYRVSATMIAGDSYVEDSNCVKTTIEEELKREMQARAEADTALGERITSEAEARAEADTALGQRIDDEAEARSEADTALGERITSEAQARSEADTALGERITDEVQNLLNAITNNKYHLTYINALKVGVVANDESAASSNVEILNDLLSSNNIVFLPAGRYYIDAPLVIEDGSGLFSENSDRCIIEQLTSNTNGIELPVRWSPSNPNKVETNVILYNIRLFNRYTGGIGLRIYNYTYEVTCNNDGAQYAAYKGNSYGLEYRNSIISHIQITKFDIGLKCGVGTGVIIADSFFIDTCDSVGFLDQSADATFNNFNITFCGASGISANTTIANKYCNFKVYQNGKTSVTAGVLMYNCRCVQIANMNTEENKGPGVQFINCSDVQIDIMSNSNGFENTSTDDYSKAGMLLQNTKNITGKLTAVDKNAAFFGGTASQTYGISSDAESTGLIIYAEDSNIIDYSALNADTKKLLLINDEAFVTTNKATTGTNINSNFSNFIKFENNIQEMVCAFDTTQVIPANNYVLLEDNFVLTGNHKTLTDRVFTIDFVGIGSDGNIYPLRYVSGVAVTALVQIPSGITVNCHVMASYSF